MALFSYFIRLAGDSLLIFIRMLTIVFKISIICLGVAVMQGEVFE